MILLLLGESIGRWQELEYYEGLTLSRSARCGGRPRIIPVVIAERPAPGLPFLSSLHQIFALNPSSIEALSAIEAALNASPKGEAIEPWKRFQPYKGLEALTTTDAAFFFGRDKETTDLLNLLVHNRGRILTIIGQSGVGKSSLVFAGVLSRLKSQLWPIDGVEWPSGLGDSRSYLQLTMQPGREPVKDLAVCLARLYSSGNAAIDEEASGWARRFRHGALLRDMLRLARDKIAEAQGGYPPKRFVLYVDQGEELYTRAAVGEARHFSHLLAEAVGDNSCTVIMSLRSDFYANFQSDTELFSLSDKFDVLPFSRDALIEVIRKPAEVLGARFEDAAIPIRVAEAAEGEPGALPLLSDLMHETWLSMLNRSDGVLRWSDQPGIVDISLPLRRRADAFLQIPTVDPKVVRKLFTLRLAQVSNIGEPVRRRARKGECTPEEWSIAEKLAASDERLLTISNPLLGLEPCIEVAHEQLLQSWPQLKRWLEEERDFLTWRTDVEQAASEYVKVEDKKKTEALLMGLRLTTAKVWLDKRRNDLSGEVAEFIDKSKQYSARKQRIRRGGLVSATVLLSTFSLIAAAGWKKATLEEQKASTQERSTHNLADGLAKIIKDVLDIIVKEEKTNDIKLTTAQHLLSPIISTLKSKEIAWDITPKRMPIQIDVFHVLADTLFNIGQKQAALDILRQQEAIVASIYADDPSNTRWILLMYENNFRIGDILAQSEGASSARTRYETALTFANRLSSTTADAITLKRRVAFITDKLGDTYLMDKNYETAIKYYEDSYNVGLSMLKIDSGGETAAKVIADAEYRIGLCYEATNELAQAGNHFAKAAEIQLNFADKKPEDAIWQSNLEKSVDKSAKILMKITIIKARSKNRISNSNCGSASAKRS